MTATNRLLADRMAVVTGGASGIDRKIALDRARDGANIDQVLPAK